MEAGAWPLVGRHGELDTLRAVLGDDAASSVVLAGAAGVGKSRLASECLAGLRDGGVHVHNVLATRAAAGLPLGAFGTALPEGHAVPRREELFAAVERALRRAGGAVAPVLFVDDAHLLDDTSAALMLHLASSGGVRVLATLRVGEPRPDAVDALWKEERLGRRVDLAPLPETQIGAVLEAALGAPVEPATVRALAARSEGNMLFLTELVRGAVEQDVLSKDHDVWRLRGPLAPSQRLGDLVESRLTGLDDAERTALEIVALGEPLAIEDLLDLVPDGMPERLEARGLLRLRPSPGRGAEIRLAHPLYGEVLRARLPALRARRLTRSLAAAVTARGSLSQDDVLRVAVWGLDAGEPGSTDLLTDAAVIARNRFDHALARRLARAAVAAGGGFRPALIAAETLIGLGRPDDAETELAALAPQASTDAEIANLAATRIANLALWVGRPDDALAAATEALARVQDPVLRGDIAAHQATALYTKGEFRSMRTALAEIYADPGPANVQAAMVAAFGDAQTGRMNDSLALIDRVPAFPESAGLLPVPPLMLAAARAQLLIQLGRLAEGEAVVSSAYAAGVESGSLLSQAWSALPLARIALLRGDPGAAARWARIGLGISDIALTLYRYLGTELALALALLGEVAEARAALERVEQTATWASARDVELPVVRAWLCVAEGDLPGARDHLLAAVELARRQHALTSGTSAAHDLARIGYPGPALEVMQMWVPQIDGELAAARLRHVAALVAADAEQLLAASEGFEHLGATLLAAEAAADAATQLLRAGAHRPATAASRRAHELARACPGVRTPALRALDARAELTRSEREIALLAATGQSNREIADKLVLSIRTVENTLQRVYQKLGVAGRRDLAGVLLE